MNDETIRKSLNSAFNEAESSKVPGFNEVWANAERVHGASIRRVRLIRSVSAVLAVAVIAAALWPSQQVELTDEYLIADALMNSTLWLAPSDSLMPVHQFDIYQEIPFLIESTNSLEGTLL